MVVLQRLARFLDRPFFPWKTAVIGFHIGQYIFDNLLLLRQYRVYQRTTPPKALEQEVDKVTFDKSQVRGHFLLCIL
jgi:STE24 endopeptidase